MINPQDKMAEAEILRDQAANSFDEEAAEHASVLAALSQAAALIAIAQRLEVLCEAIAGVSWTASVGYRNGEEVYHISRD